MKSYVLISGAAGGLGKAFAAECAARGWNLFLTDLSEEALAPIAAGLERMFGAEVRTYAADLTDPAAREALWEYVRALGLRFHFLFNVAGIDYEGLFDERQISELRTILRLNVESTVEMTRCVLQQRDYTRTLHVVNVSSLARGAVGLQSFDLDGQDPDPLPVGLAGEERPDDAGQHPGEHHQHQPVRDGLVRQGGARVGTGSHGTRSFDSLRVGAPTQPAGQGPVRSVPRPARCWIVAPA